VDERPLIGTAWLKPDYRSALEQAGARIRELTPNDSLPAALDACDGLLLTGGVDVEPARYGESRHPTVETDEVRDAYELALAREALERNLPVLAICRGAQVLNVAAGGTLMQDIPSVISEALTHQIERPKNSIAHDVHVEAGSCLARLLEGRLNPDRTIAVNSRHHQ
jgi:putative glutamine amidotransferase